MLREGTLALGLIICVLCNDGAAADALPQPKTWRIGVLQNFPLDSAHPSLRWEAFRDALRERGYVEGTSISFEWAFGEANSEKYAAAAKQLVQSNVDLLLVGSGTAAHAAHMATTTIPIVMAGVADPVGQKLVGSLAHPGGNITGVADDQLDLFPKRLEFLKMALPKLSRLGVLVGNFGAYDASQKAAGKREGASIAQKMGVTTVGIEIDSPQGLGRATAVIREERLDALLLIDNPANYVLRKQIADFALVKRLPTIAAERDHAIAGIMMSYGPSAIGIYRRAATYVDKIFGGATPADLPVEQSSAYELIINLKTANAIGVTIPPSLLLRADEVIR